MDEVILSRIRQEAYEQGYQDGKVDGYNLAGTRMSSAKQERKRGKWIPVTNGRGGHECSMCHMYAPSFLSGDENLSPYCPNCGTEMKGSEE